MSPQSDSFVVEPGDQASSVIIHVPHAATFIPDLLYAGFTLDRKDVDAEAVLLADIETDQLAAAAADLSGVRPWQFVNRTSRLVVDPERFEDDAQESAAAFGQGVVYVRTADRRQLRNAGTDREPLLVDYYRPYHRAFDDLARSLLAVHGTVTVIDLHSYPLVPLPTEMVGPGVQRPDVCVGTDPFHTPETLAVAARTAVTSHGLSVGLDQPYVGCFIPSFAYGIDPRVRGVMLEIRRDVYTDALGRWDVTRPHPTARVLADLVGAATLDAFG
ncbi:MAG: N-formylglutamate amidohydrolase [Actinomycetes bacterium]